MAALRKAASAVALASIAAAVVFHALNATGLLELSGDVAYFALVTAVAISLLEPSSRERL